jgi:hypothetical protein
LAGFEPWWIGAGDATVDEAGGYMIVLAGDNQDDLRHIRLNIDVEQPREKAYGRLVEGRT